MKKFTKDNLNIVRNEIESALAIIEKKHSISFNFGNIHFGDNSFTCKLTSNIGTPDDARRQDWDRYCKLYDFEIDDFGKEFSFKGNKYIIVGLDTKKRKYKIITKEVGSGKTVYFVSSGVLEQIRK